MSKISAVEAKRVFKKANRLRRECSPCPSMRLSDRALFKAGLITRREYEVLTDPSTHHDSRWWSQGKGRWVKRRLSKARRRARKQKPRRSLMSIESECNWKGT